MKTAAIICEYDPFHYGHKKQIELIKSELGENTVIISLMSGSTVQRGRFSLYPKHVRAEAALLNGSDAVFELPCPYCCAGAEGFATGAVNILNDLTNIDHLVFGSENGNITSLMKSAQIINSKEYIEALKQEKSSSSHINRCESVFKSLGGGDFPSQPNDILAVEYLAALMRMNSSVMPFTYKREEGFSATEARKALFSSADASEHIPSEALNIFEKEELTDVSAYEAVALYKIRQSSSEALSRFYGMNGGVSGLIKANAEKVTSLEDLVALCTGKSYTSSRIRRAILSAVLEITENDIKAKPLFTTLLVTSDKGREYLNSIR